MNRHPVLIWPPIAEPSMPPLGIADLCTFLQHTNPACSVIDSNLEFLRLVPVLTQASPPSSNAPPHRWPRASNTALAGCGHDEFINAYKAASRERSQSLDRLCQKYRYSPAPSFLHPSEEPGNLSEMRENATDPCGLYQRWLNQSTLLPCMRATNPCWIGIGINYAGQLPFAIALASRVKREGLGPVIVGGALLRDFAGCIGPDTPLWDIIDVMVIGAGEHVRDARREVTTTPRYDAFPLDDYHAVARTLPVRISAHCSWGRCAYCADAKYDADMVGPRLGPGAAAERLWEVAQRHEACALCFADSELPADFLIPFAAALKGRTGGQVHFGCNARFARPLAVPSNMESLRSAGCTFLRFGLESGSNRLLREMRKGISSDLAAAVLQACAQAGILTHVYIMTGYPGETDADWAKTRGFVMDNLHLIDMCSISSFELYEGAPLFAAFPSAAIDSRASDGNWVHPKVRRQPSEGEDIAGRIHAFENEFYSAKRFTRVFHSLADTISLGGKARIPL